MGLYLDALDAGAMGADHGRDDDAPDGPEVVTVKNDAGQRVGYVKRIGFGPMGPAYEAYFGDERLGVHGGGEDDGLSRALQAVTEASMKASKEARP